MTPPTPRLPAASATGCFREFQEYEAEQADSQARYQRRMDNAGYVLPTPEEEVRIRQSAAEVEAASKSPELWAAWLERQEVRRKCEELIAAI